MLHPRDEAELVKYIRGLTERHLMPTRQMIVNFVTPLASWEPSDSWVTRFLHRNSDTLLTAWSTPMETSRHLADSGAKYSKYFELLHQKMTDYDILPENTYNMDEKGFMIGVTGKSKRVFDKLLYGQKQFKQSLHDGNREWVTLLAAICGDGTHLPPGIIFPAAGRAVQADWVHEIDPRKHSIHFTTSINGWTSNDLGLTWLEQVFDRYTKGKARRRWRLLIIDGHGSHVTKDFISYCDSHKILLMVFPPHATHTLQPLDVVCFKPLAQNYTKELDQHNFDTQGKAPVKKSDFFSLFWPAWVNTFTKKLVLTAFETTGIHPPNANVILSRFRTPSPPIIRTPPEQTGPQAASTEPNWLKAKSLLRSVVKDNAGRELGALEQLLHQLHVQLELAQSELQGVKQALANKEKKKRKKKVLPLYAHNVERHGGAMWWSPASKREADAREAAFKAYQEKVEAEKATRRELQQTQKLLKEKQRQERCDVREREKEERARLNAVKAAEVAQRKAQRERNKQAHNAAEAVQLPQRGKRKASNSPAPRKKQNRGAVAARRGVVAAEPLAAPRTHTTRSGRTATLYN